MLDRRSEGAAYVPMSPARQPSGSPGPGKIARQAQSGPTIQAEFNAVGRTYFENQVLVDEFFRPIQRPGISDLQARAESPFLNAAG
jgi:hypothetical protein